MDDRGDRGDRDDGRDEAPGHGPADPWGYCVTQGPDGWVWTRRADDATSSPFPSREEAVRAAAADRDARGA